MRTPSPVAGTAAAPQQGNNPWLTYGLPLAGSLGLSFLGSGGRLTGQTVTSPQMPADIMGLRQNVISWLQGAGATPNMGGAQPYGGVNQQGGFGGMGSGPLFAGGTGVGVPTVTNPVPPPTPGRSFTDGGLPPGVGSNAGGVPGFGGGSGVAPSVVPGGGGGGFGNIYTPTPALFNPATAEAGQIGPLPTFNNTTIGPVGSANFQPVAAAGSGSAAGFLDPRFDQLFSSIRTLGNDIGFAPAVASQVRPVADIASVAGMSQNLANIINSPGVNGYFRDVILKPYQDVFAQNRSLGLAAAREGAGNLTGTGYAAALGDVINRSIPQENAALADILTQLAGGEQGRQLQVAGLEQGRNVQNQNTQLTRATTDANNATSASIANAGNSAQLAGQTLGARTSLTGQGLNLFGNMAVDAARRADEMGMFNAGQANQVGLQQAMQNAQAITQAAIAQGQISSNEAQNFFNQQVAAQIAQANNNQSANQFNAGQFNQAGMFNTQLGTNVAQQNAQNFLNLLLPLLSGGVGPGQQQYQPGAVDAFSQILPYLFQFWGSRPTVG
jgi:hypothetical protein